LIVCTKLTLGLEFSVRRLMEGWRDQHFFGVNFNPAPGELPPVPANHQNPDLIDLIESPTEWRPPNLFGGGPRNNVGHHHNGGIVFLIFKIVFYDDIF